MSTMAPAAPIPTPPSSNSEKIQYDHGLLRIRENTLVIGNSIYPIANISTITFADLRTPKPRIVWITFVLGLICLPFEEIAVVGLILVCIAIYLAMVHENSRSAADFALSIRMNAGNTAVVSSNDGKFLKAIALELYEVIELEKPSNTTFNIDQKVRIDNITGSTLRITGIQGDIVNNVPAA